MSIPFDWFMREPHQLQPPQPLPHMQEDEPEDETYEEGPPDVELTGQELLEGMETGQWREGGMICFDQSVIPEFLDMLFRSGGRQDG